MVEGHDERAEYEEEWVRRRTLGLIGGMSWESTQGY